MNKKKLFYILRPKFQAHHCDLKIHFGENWKLFWRSIWSKKNVKLSAYENIREKREMNDFIFIYYYSHFWVFCKTKNIFSLPLYNFLQNYIIFILTTLSDFLQKLLYVFNGCLKFWSPTDKWQKMFHWENIHQNYIRLFIRMCSLLTSYYCHK